MTDNQNPGNPDGVRLSDYLESRGESQAAFARRSGIPQSTINLICNGKGTRVETAIKIIRATGGLVALEDLAVDDGDGDGAGAAA